MSEYYEIEITLLSNKLVEYESDEQDQDDAVGGAPSAEEGETMQHVFTGVSYDTDPMVTIVPYTDWALYVTSYTNDGAGTVTVNMKVGAAGSLDEILYKVRISQA